MPEHLNALRAIEPPVVVQPAPHHRVGKSRQVLQALVIPGGRHPPVADGLTYPLGGLGTDGRQETDEELSPPVLLSSRVEGASRPLELHHQPLSETSVTLSRHSAPIRQTYRSCQSANARRDARPADKSSVETGLRGPCEL